MCDDPACEEEVLEWYRKVVNEVDKAYWAQFDLSEPLQGNSDLRVFNWTLADNDEIDSSDDSLPDLTPAKKEVDPAEEIEKNKKKKNSGVKELFQKLTNIEEKMKSKNDDDADGRDNDEGKGLQNGPHLDSETTNGSTPPPPPPPPGMDRKQTDTETAMDSDGEGKDSQSSPLGSGEFGCTPPPPPPPTPTPDQN